jgi:threonine aldolase
LRNAGVVINPPKGTRIRLVTHHDVTAAEITEVVRRIAPLAREFIDRIGLRAHA